MRFGVGDVNAVGVSTKGVNVVGIKFVLIGATDRRRWTSSDVLDRWRFMGDGSFEVDVEYRGRGIDDRRDVLPDFEFGVVVEVVEGPAAAAASSLTIRFLPVSHTPNTKSGHGAQGGQEKDSPISKPGRDLLKCNSNSL